MKSIAEIKFDRVIKEGFHELLKPIGFKKKANNFYLQNHDLGQLINIQKSSFYSKDHIHFTINSGLFLPQYWSGLIYNAGKEIPTFPTEIQCLLTERIGKLRNQNDTWYDVEEKTNEDILISEMQANLNEFILPYFDKLKTKNSFLAAIESAELYLAPLSKLIVYAELKEYDKARIEYQKILSEKTNPDFLKTVNEYAKKYRLLE